MQNRNVLEKTGNIENAIKNGEYPFIILFDGIFNPTEKILNSFIENIEKENNESFKRVLFKTKSAFRIGVIRVECFYFKDIIVKDKKYIFNKEKFTNIIKDFCKNHKQTMFLLPMSSISNNFKKEIYEILETHVHDTKITILN